MPFYNWEVYCGTPAWRDVEANTLVFSGNATDLTAVVNVDGFNIGTHLGSGDPGVDQCGAVHAPNIMYVSETVCSKDGGNTTTTVCDANIPSTACSFRIKFTDTGSVVVSDGRMFTFNGIDRSVAAIGVLAYALEQGQGSTAFSTVNNYNSVIGGDNSTSALALADQGSSTEHYFYVAVSVQPTSPGPKTFFDFGVALVYS